MNGDKLFRLLMILCLAMGIMGLTVGKFILGGIFIGLAVAVWLTTGGKHYNDRNIYDKIVEDSEAIMPCSAMKELTPARAESLLMRR